MRIAAVAALVSLAALAGPALAQDKPAAADEQVVVPQVDRRDVDLPHFPSRDFEVGLFVGSYATENFGTSAVTGLRAGYHLTEDFFVEGAYGRTKVSDESYRQILPGGIFVNETETLSYYNLSVGYNVLPGEVFIGAKRAKATALYVIGGVGSTDFVDQKRQTINVGFGWRMLFNDRSSVRLDLRDHIYSLDILGERKSTQNIEVSLGLSLFF